MAMVTRSRRYSNPLGHGLPVIIVPYNPALFQGKPRPFSQVRNPANTVLRKAHQYSMLLDQGLVNTHAKIAQREGISRISVTRTMSLLKLAPKIQEYLLSLTDPKQAKFFTEKRLREITRITDQETQLTKFQELKNKGTI